MIKRSSDDRPIEHEFISRIQDQMMHPGKAEAMVMNARVLVIYLIAAQSSSAWVKLPFPRTGAGKDNISTLRR